MVLFSTLGRLTHESNHGFLDMVIDNDPPITRHISIPKEMSQLSCSAFTAGIVEAVLDGLCFVSGRCQASVPFMLKDVAIAGESDGTLRSD